MSPLSRNTGEVTARKQQAFTLTEVIVAVLILAVAAVACVALVANRDTQYDKTTAVSGAPAAIDALSYYFDNKADVDSLAAEIVAGGAARVVCRVQDGSDALWQVVDSDDFTSMKGVVGPVYFAALTHPKIYENTRAVEFDVTLGWIAPGLVTEGAQEIKTRLLGSAELCTYRAIILRK